MAAPTPRDEVAQAVTPALERLTGANTLLSGIGFATEVGPPITLGDSGLTEVPREHSAPRAKSGFSQELVTQ